MSDIAIGIRFPGNEFKFDREGLDIWLDAVNSTGFDHIVVTTTFSGLTPRRPALDGQMPSPATNLAINPTPTETCFLSRWCSFRTWRRAVISSWPRAYLFFLNARLPS